jgi:hypothetical protein
MRCAGVVVVLLTPSRACPSRALGSGLAMFVVDARLAETAWSS